MAAKSGYLNKDGALMTHNLHKKVKFIVIRYFKNMCAPGEKIKIKK